MTVLAHKDFRFARKLRRSRKSEDEIVAAFQGRYTFEEILDGIVLHRERIRLRSARVARNILPKIDRVLPAADVMAARAARAALSPVSLTAAICGDPLPGRSALAAPRADRRASGYRGDYLDGLVFGVRT